jgi:arginine/ornithine transport system substrate-binding protein
MKKLLSASLLSVILSTLISLPLAAQEVRKIKIGVEGAYPPFSQIGIDGKLKGFDIDIANALCEQMKAQCTLVQQEFDGLIPSLQAKKIDAVIASMSITEERQKVVDFTDKYYRTPTRFVAKKNAGLTITAAGLKGKRVGVQRTTTYDRFATDTFKESEIVRYAKQDDVFLDLAAGRLDGTLVDWVAASEGFLKTAAGKEFGFLGPVFIDFKYFGVGAGIAVRKGETVLRNDFNAAIKAIRANGTYKKIQDKYFEFDVFGS